MRKKYKKSGYSTKLAEEYIEKSNAIHSISTELEEQYKYEDNKRTDEISGYKAWFSQKDLPPFAVKFEKKIDLPEYLSIVTIENLQAIEVNYNVYFKADDIKVIK
ncbi:hypothetical protein [Vagococcus silagei]|uniref:SuB0782 undefined product 764400:764714 forward MW:11955 n=1 Tax=Vagococcus silagei TaxID=2508885 RepID=A0A4V3TV44_9ENTE|nr:hypothetical protein [Vagococcus silagei]THB61419.1 hypothetical protein ESZ54_05075 [Vagococcus silagei]